MKRVTETAAAINALRAEEETKAEAAGGRA